MVIKSILFDKKYIILYLINILVVGLLSVYCAIPANAEYNGRWTDTSAPLIPKVYPGEYSEHAHCDFEYISVAGATNKKRACIAQGEAVRMGMYFDQGWRSVVGFPGDNQMYHVRGLETWGYVSYKLTNGGDTLVTGETSPAMAVYKSVSERFRRQINASTGVVEYVFDGTNPDYVLRYTNGITLRPRSVSVSENGKWAIVENSSFGVIRVDLITFQARVISGDYTQDYNPTPHLAISDNGRYVAVSSLGTLKFIDINDDCGNYNLVYGGSIGIECPKRLLSHTIPAGSTYFRATALKFSPDAGQFSYSFRTTTGVDILNSVSSITVFDAPGYESDLRLDYLSLGDSYSSGEGDTALAGGGKYYRDGTDNEEDQGGGIPREKCHVSTRSYPYILAQGMNLGMASTGMTAGWQTVACSGAQLWDANDTASDNYRGQGKGGRNIWDSNGGVSRLEGYEVSRLKVQGLNEYIPGRNKQVEFVKKYRPKAITLTLGGNDVGFGGKISECVTHVSSVKACKIVSEAGRKEMAAEIKGKFEELKNFYAKMRKESSGQTKVYVLGYPKIVNPATDAVCPSFFVLDSLERQAINDGFEYMNSVIKDAADAARVKYIDVQDAFDGHRLCDNGKVKYATGLAMSVPGLSTSNELQESFHPNAAGNAAMAVAVNQQLVKDGVRYNLLTYPYDGIQFNGSTEAPAPTGAMAPAPGESIKKTQLAYLTNEPAVRGQSLMVTVKNYQLHPGSQSSVYLYGRDTSIGTVAVNQQGGFEGLVNVPADVTPGVYTVMVPGETYSGEPIQLEQVIEVRGDDPNDIDGDGTLDAQDKCLYVASANKDEDADGIDDACDPEITESPLPYRARLGDPSRLYGTAPEKGNYIYIERNVKMSAKAGVSGDYDPDGDGWAVVGASRGVSFTKRSVPDTGPIANFVITGEGAATKPVVYIRAGGYGCVGYTPANLGKAVKIGQVRTLKRVAMNTDKCRQAAPDADVDGNGVPDDRQPLYEARQGDVSRGENSKRIYLFRNFHAAEAQLGISDYSPTGTAAGRGDEPIQAWNLLASSRSDTVPAFNKLVMSTDDKGNPLPIVLTKKQNGQCVAYRPSSTKIIKMTTQDKRGFSKMSKLPQGVSCS